jgi:hypothetical protein
MWHFLRQVLGKFYRKNFYLDWICARGARCYRDSIGYHINAKRQKTTSHQFSKLSNFLKILRFFSKSGVTEIFHRSATNADPKAISIFI